MVDQYGSAMCVCMCVCVCVCKREREGGSKVLCV